MKILHVADLHLGKTIYGVSLIDSLDQPKWVEEFIKTVDQENPDVILIAGDVFDRSAPKDDAYQLLDHMITEIQKRGIPLFIVAGNHDSGIKLQHLNQILWENQVYIVGKLEKELKKVVIKDEYGPVNFYFLPYIFPNLVAHVLEDESIKDYNTAMKAILEIQEINPKERNVLIAHQNVVANGEHAQYGGSETMVGGSGEIDYQVFKDFDYVALGHIHSSYPVGREGVRYAGSPLCYHFDEIRQTNKGPLLVHLKGKGEDLTVDHIRIEPYHRMVEIKGTMAEIKERLENNYMEREYYRLVITDQRTSPDFTSLVRNLALSREGMVLEIVSEYKEFSKVTPKTASTFHQKTLEEYFTELYRNRKDEVDPDEIEEKVIEMTAELVRKAEEEEKLAVPTDQAVDCLLNQIMKMF